MNYQPDLSDQTHAGGRVNAVHDKKVTVGGTTLAYGHESQKQSSS
jgi:hypothetical protein